MKIWKEAKTVELDLSEVIELLRQNFLALSEANFEIFKLNDWMTLRENLDGLQQMTETVITKLSN